MADLLQPSYGVPTPSLLSRLSYALCELHDNAFCGSAGKVLWSFVNIAAQWAICILVNDQVPGLRLCLQTWSYAFVIVQEDVRVLGTIGEGAFGEVSLASATVFGKVAIKWLKVQTLQPYQCAMIMHMIELG